MRRFFLRTWSARQAQRSSRTRSHCSCGAIPRGWLDGLRFDSLFETRKARSRIESVLDPRLGLVSRVILVMVYDLREVRPNRASRARHRALRVELKRCSKSYPRRCRQPPAMTTVSPMKRRVLFLVFFSVFFEVQRAVHKTAFLAPHTSGPRDVPRCGALSLLQKDAALQGGIQQKPL